MRVLWRPLIGSTNVSGHLRPLDSMSHDGPAKSSAGPVSTGQLVSQQKQFPWVLPLSSVGEKAQVHSDTSHRSGLDLAACTSDDKASLAAVHLATCKQSPLAFCSPVTEQGASSL